MSCRSEGYGQRFETFFILGRYSGEYGRKEQNITRTLYRGATEGQG